MDWTVQSECGNDSCSYLAVCPRDDTAVMTSSPTPQSRASTKTWLVTDGEWARADYAKHRLNMQIQLLINDW